jgi:hypothetical protein
MNTMPDSIAALPRTIQDLLEKRHMHVQALASIDAMLGRVNAVLAGVSSAAMPPSVAPVAKVANPGGTKKTKSNGETSNEFVLGFIKEKKNPTSQEVNAAWKAAGRSRTADITLSLLTKAKRLKRTPLGPGIRGSRYSIPA